MRLNRFAFIIASSALCTACAVAQPTTPGFQVCLNDITEAAAAQGVSQQVSESLLSEVTPDPKVIEFDRRQPEFTQTFADYLETRVSTTRLNQGRQQLKDQANILDRVAAEHGVPAHYLVAFWGLETNYGQYLGRMSTVRSLATLACDTRRSAFFREELIAALQLVDAGTVSPEQLKGSWAGAVGNFQFLPSVYRDHAVDADGDGSIDLWDNFADAAESAARFLRARGWEPGERWGREVSLPAAFDYQLTDTTASVDDWSARGVMQADSSPLPSSDITARLLLPAGAQGPAFLVYPNFDVIMRWNPSQFYALAVGHLADRLNGAEPLVQSAPNEPALSTDAVSELQRNLSEAGFNSGPIDGRMGPATRQGIRAYQLANGLVPDGHPTQETLNELGIKPSPR